MEAVSELFVDGLLKFLGQWASFSRFFCVLNTDLNEEEPRNLAVDQPLRLVGDIAHIASIGIVIHKLHSTGSSQGMDKVPYSSFEHISNSISLPGMSFMRPSSSPSKSFTPPSQAVHRLETSVDLSAASSTVATWDLMRKKNWKEVKVALQPARGRSGSRQAKYAKSE